MGQKVNPISNRLGIIRGWDSNWYGGKNYGDSLLEDSKIRKYLNARLAKASVSRIVIERTLKLVTITVCTARPGIIIGKGGQEVDKLKEELKNFRKLCYNRKKQNSEDNKKAVKRVMPKEETSWLSDLLVLRPWKRNGLQAVRLKLRVLQ